MKNPQHFFYKICKLFCFCFTMCTKRKCSQLEKPRFYKSYLIMHSILLHEIYCPLKWFSLKGEGERKKDYTLNPQGIILQRKLQRFEFRLNLVMLITWNKTTYKISKVKVENYPKTIATTCSFLIVLFDSVLSFFAYIQVCPSLTKKICSSYTNLTLKENTGEKRLKKNTILFHNLIVFF